MVRVSIIIPVYNVEEYLRECLESIINQTYTELEIICINDCSTDNSPMILAEYEQKDSRIIVLQNEKNRGLAYTRNQGLKKATGEYILFVDSDDMVCLDIVESCMNVGYGNDIVCFDYEQITGDKNAVRQFPYKMKDGFYAKDSFFIEAVGRESIIFAAWSRFFSRSFLTENNLSFYNGILFEDILFSFQCHIKAGRIYSLNKKLYKYRVRQQSIMTMNITGKSIESYIICICELTKLYLQGDFSQKMGYAIEAYIRKVGREYISGYRKWANTELEPELLKDKPEYLKLYRTFSELFIKSGKLSDISTEQIDKIRQYPYVVLYGAGDIARSTIEILDQYDISIYGIAVSNGQQNKKSLLGNPVRELQDYYEIREKCLVLIGTIPRYYDEIREQLQKNGFLHWLEIIDICGDEEHGR